MAWCATFLGDDTALVLWADGHRRMLNQLGEVPRTRTIQVYPRPTGASRTNPMTHSIQVSEILSHKGGTVWSVSPDATVLEAIQMMADKNVGALLVTKDNHLVGVLSERDYTRKVILKGRSSKDTPVRDIISGKVISVSPDHSVEECMKLMTEHRIRHLPVVQGPKILGVISIGDLVNSIISHQTSAIQQLETYITGFPTPPA